MNSETVTKRFIDAFDSKDKKHVQWLSKFYKYSNNLATSQGNIGDFIDSNPFGIKVTKDELLEWVHIHFCLAMKYSRDVLESNAWIPEK